MDKVLIDWYDIEDDLVMDRVLKTRNCNSISIPSLYIKTKIIDYLLKHLTQEERDLINLYFYEGYSLRKIAKLYNTNHNDILKRLKGILKKMMEVFYAKIDVLQGE